VDDWISEYSHIQQFPTKNQISDDPSTFWLERIDLFSSIFSHYPVCNYFIEEEMEMKITGWLAILMLVLGGNLILAQESVLSFDELEKEISIGESVRIIDKSGDIIKGRVEDITPESLLLKGRRSSQLNRERLDLPVNSIRVIQKERKDPWWNGFIIGGGAGAVGGLILAKTQCSNDSECSAIARVIFIPAGMAIGMATGALIDRAVTKYDTVFTGNKASTEQRFQISPVISREQKGINISLAF
jgi:hypothetical protein